MGADFTFLRFRNFSNKPVQVQADVGCGVFHPPGKFECSKTFVGVSHGQTPVEREYHQPANHRVLDCGQLKGEVILREVSHAGVYVPMGKRRSIVCQCAVKTDACLLLDEFAAVEPEDLHEVQDFMLSFALSDDGEVLLSDLGEGTRELFEEKIYPVLYQSKQEAGAGVEEPVKAEGRESGQRSRKRERGFRAR